MSSLVLAILGLGGGGESPADEIWYNQPRVSAGVTYNDNIGLSPTDARSSFGAQAQAAIRAGRRSETTDLGIDAALGGTTYFDDSQDDSVNLRLGFGVDHRRDLNRFGLNAGLSYLPTTVSEVETTGNLAEDNAKLTWSLAPSWAYQLTERSDLQLLVGYTQSTYQNPEPDLRDYWNVSGSLLGSYEVSEVTRATARLSYLHYQSSNPENMSDSVGLSAGLQHQFSEVLKGVAELGLRQTDSEREAAGFGMIKDSSTGPLFDLGLNWQRETGAWSLHVGRTLTPSGGGLNDTSRVSLTGTQQLSERWGLNFGMQAFYNRNDEGTTTSTLGNRKYAAAYAGFSYQLAPDWRLQGTYRFAWQEREEEDGTGTGNSVFLNVSYAWPRELPGLFSGPR